MSNGVLYTIIAFVVFIAGFILGYVVRFGLSRAKKYAGVLRVTKEEDKRVYSLEIVGDPSDLEFEDEIVFKVLPSG